MTNVRRNNEADATMEGQSKSKIGKMEAVVQVDSKVVADPNNSYIHRTKQGIAIVIIQEHFHHSLKLPTRDGIDKDRGDVCEILKKLGFEVRVLNDPTKSELFKELKNTAQSDHSNNNCLMVVVLTHGDQGNLYARDKNYKVDELWNIFTKDFSKQVANTPKLFFINACSYEKPGSNNNENIHTTAADSTSMSQSSPRKYTIPKTANLLVMYSTYDGYKPWRVTSNGSWFIQSLCAMLKAHGHTKGLLQILTAVSQNILNNYRQFVPTENDEQMYALKKPPVLLSTLTRDFRFNRKKLDKGTVRTLYTDGPAKNSDDYYNMQNMNRKAYIFHHHTFEVDPFRNGRKSGTNDPTKLKTTLEKLGFSVASPFKDQTREELKKPMESIALENHMDTGSILFVIMTCEKDNLLFAKDDTYPVTELWDTFSKTNCPTLSGKPKVFLIQAYTNGITNSNSILPKDVLVMYSFYNEIADRNEQAQPSPTVYIQTLCEEFDANGKTQDLFSMLETVRRIIANIADVEDQEANNQMAILASNLSKKLEL